MDILNAILNNRFITPMLMTAFLVQVLVTKHKNFQIDNLMTMLKQSSMWISTNKKFLPRNLYQNGLQMNLQPLFNAPHLIKETSIGQYLRNNLSIKLTLTKISLITSAKRRGNIGGSTLKYNQVASTPTISRIYSTEIRQWLTWEKLCHGPEWRKPKVILLDFHHMALLMRA